MYTFINNRKTTTYLVQCAVLKAMYDQRPAPSCEAEFEELMLAVVTEDEFARMDAVMCTHGVEVFNELTIWAQGDIEVLTWANQVDVPWIPFYAGPNADLAVN